MSALVCAALCGRACPPSGGSKVCDIVSVPGVVHHDRGTRASILVTKGVGERTFPTRTLGCGSRIPGATVPKAMSSSGAQSVDVLAVWDVALVPVTCGVLVLAVLKQCGPLRSGVCKCRRSDRCGWVSATSSAALWCLWASSL